MTQATPATHGSTPGVTIRLLEPGSDLDPGLSCKSAGPPLSFRKNRLPFAPVSGVPTVEPGPLIQKPRMSILPGAHLAG